MAWDGSRLVATEFTVLAIQVLMCHCYIVAFGWRHRCVQSQGVFFFSRPFRVVTF